MELPGGTVTPGHVDARRVAATVPLPQSLRGKRCLDVGTRDGFWAFEMERRHAAEVVAVDGPDERHRPAFDHAREALGSKVDRRDVSVADLSPETVGEFDVVHCGSLTLGLRDPVAAMAAVRSVCRELLVFADAIDPAMTRVRRRTPTAVLDGRGGSWWRFNLAGLARVAESAGFDVLSGPVRFDLPYGPGGPDGADPHAALLARPR